MTDGVCDDVLDVVEGIAGGVLHTNVGQKLLICYPFKSFLRLLIKSFEHRI